jgi:cytoskeletal protein CcmA (bactofilin family)
MFNKNTPEGGSIDKKDIETIIGASVKVEGNFSCEGNMIIDGQVKGNVQTNGFLQVGRTAIVIADVKAGNSKIGGEIRGTVKIDGYLEINETAKIYGDIEASSISIARGAFISGHCSTLAEAQSPKKKSESKSSVENS